MDKVRLGVIGLGQRGKSLVKDLFLIMPQVVVSALCDDFGDRAQEVAEYVQEKTGELPFFTKDWTQLLHRDDVDALLVFTPWEMHIPMAIAAMKAGKPVGIEVGGATSVQQCWDLVRAWEETRTPFMFMENCCYGQTEMTVMNMVRKGMFGEIVHCEGAYAHDLRDEISEGEERHHYRLRHYKNRNGENYPTHELGPIAKVLNINSGNRMVSLTAMSSKAAGLKEYLRTHKAAGCDETTDFAQGDVFTTCIRCANGESIILQLDTTLPRYYSRNFTVRGTKGLYEEKTNSVYLDGDGCHFDWKGGWNNFEKYLEEHEHPLWKKFRQGGIVGGHGGMDGLVYGAFAECLLNGWEMPIDVYDAAAWMSITPLSEASARMGGMPQEIPDFTDGRWMERETRDSGDYTL